MKYQVKPLQPMCPEEVNPKKFWRSDVNTFPNVGTILKILLNPCLYDQMPIDVMNLIDSLLPILTGDVLEKLSNIYLDKDCISVGYQNPEYDAYLESLRSYHMAMTDYKRKLDTYERDVEKWLQEQKKIKQKRLDNKNVREN